MILYIFPICVRFYPQNQLKLWTVQSFCDSWLSCTFDLSDSVALIILCVTGLSIHTFHGNFFVRSTDLLSLPNISPDAGFGVQVSIEDTLDVNYVSFQAALLYTSSKGEQLSVVSWPTFVYLSETFGVLVVLEQ